MKGPLAVIAAGGTFTGAVVAGALLGVWLDATLHRADLVVYGFFAGVLAGGYAAFRLVADTIRSA